MPAHHQLIRNVCLSEHVAILRMYVCSSCYEPSYVDCCLWVGGILRLSREYRCMNLSLEGVVAAYGLLLAWHDW